MIRCHIDISHSALDCCLICGNTIVSHTQWDNLESICTTGQDDCKSCRAINVLPHHPLSIIWGYSGDLIYPGVKQGKLSIKSPNAAPHKPQLHGNLTYPTCKNQAFVCLCFCHSRRGNTFVSIPSVKPHIGWRGVG